MAHRQRRTSVAGVFNIAIEANDLAQLKFALKFHKARINEQDEKGSTVLHRSCLSGQLEMARLLVENGAELELRDERGWTCLHYAAFGGHVDVVNFLINSCVDVTATSHEGQLAIDVAKGEGIVFLLASAILRAGKEHLLQPYMDGSTLSSETESLRSSGDIENYEYWTPKAKRALSEEVLRASQQFLAQSFGAYVDEKFNLNSSFDKSSDKNTESPLAAIEKPKLTKKNSCPRVKNDPQPEETPRKKPRLKSFNSAFSSDVLKRYAVSETNLLGEQGDPSQKEMGAEISRAPNYFDLNNVDSDTWIYSL
ncbi:protein phosphatase 1 regulatory subunit 12B-like [Stylophora pistillata]|nr:protein phosphatase 1 regulatory subunit 12B-like [Stylophora pistillata]